MIKVYKDQLERLISPSRLSEYMAAGWTQVKAEEEIIRPKPTVKTRATVKTLDEANDIKGDE